MTKKKGNVQSQGEKDVQIVAADRTSVLFSVFNARREKCAMGWSVKRRGRDNFCCKRTGGWVKRKRKTEGRQCGWSVDG